MVFWGGLHVDLPYIQCIVFGGLKMASFINDLFIFPSGNITRDNSGGIRSQRQDIDQKL